MASRSSIWSERRRGPRPATAQCLSGPRCSPGATIYHIQEVHRCLSKAKEVVEATLDLIHGGAPDLLTTLPAPDDGLLFFFPEEPVEVEMDRLRQHLEEGTATAEELTQLDIAH